MQSLTVSTRKTATALRTQTTRKIVFRSVVVPASFSSFIIWNLAQDSKDGFNSKSLSRELRLPLLSQHRFEASLLPLQSVSVNDTTTASKAAQFIRKGKALVYQGDYHNARQLLSALKRRFLKLTQRKPENRSITELWRQQRQDLQELTQRLNMVLIHVDTDHRILSCQRRAPSGLAKILSSHFGPQTESYVIPLREVIGMIGAYEWEKNGIFIPQINKNLVPRHSVFVPTRCEYLDLLLKPPLPVSSTENTTMLEVGVGIGAITAIMMLKRNVWRAVGTDINEKAVACTRENLSKLGLADRVEVVQADVFPSQMDPVDLIVCNPPWLPGEAHTQLDLAIYDPNLSMLRRLLSKARNHLRTETGEVWLLLSNLSELLGLRSRQDLLQMIDDGNLRVAEIFETHPAHAKAKGKKKTNQESVPIQTARAAEITLLFRLKQK